MPSVRRWKLPSWADPRRALAVLGDAAARGCVTEALVERVRELESARLPRVELPGFHLFGRASPASPYTWLVPRPLGDFQDIVMMWETFVGQPHLGSRSTVTSPLAAIEEERLVLSRSAFRRFFGGPRRPGDWFTPAAKIIAIAQHLEGQENLRVAPLLEERRYERARLPQLGIHLSEYFLEVSSEGLYSNMRQALIKPPGVPGDATIDELCIRPLRTSHPLAVALIENEDTPETCLHAANVVLRALEAGQIGAHEVTLKPGTSPYTNRNAAVVAAIHALNVQRSLRAVYDLIVPNVMKAAEFRAEFGNPFRAPRVPREDTIKKWHMSLFGLAT